MVRQMPFEVASAQYFAAIRTSNLIFFPDSPLKNDF